MEMAAHYSSRVEKLILVASTTHKGYPVFKKDASLQPIVGSIYASKEEMALDPVQVLPLLNAQKTQNFSLMDAAFGAMYLVDPEADERKYYTEEALKQRNLVDVDWAISTINMSSEDSFYSKGENTIKNIHCPVLHLWGKNDLWLAPKYMTLDNYHALEKYSTLITYDECGHIIFIDQEIASTKDIIDFLNI